MRNFNFIQFHTFEGDPYKMSEIFNDIKDLCNEIKILTMSPAIKNVGGMQVPTVVAITELEFKNDNRLKEFNEKFKKTPQLKIS